MRFTDIRRNPNPTDRAIMSAPVRRVERKHGIAITGIVDAAYERVKTEHTIWGLPVFEVRLGDDRAN